MKVLTATQRGAANWYSKGSCSRQQAYLLLHCVDRNREGAILVTDFVKFVYFVWTAELSRLKSNEGERNRKGDISGVEVIRQVRRQLQKASCSHEHSHRLR